MTALRKKKKMHILLTNDDGIFSPGLFAIYKRLCEIAEVTVVAPAEVMSGASHSISLIPLTCDKVELTGKFSGYSIEGSPADCVKLGMTEIIKDKVDLVVSGINYGANVGIHVHYSGTVAAAMEGAFFGAPAIALSAAYEEDMDMDKISEYCASVVKKLLPLRPGDVMNVNIPRLSKGQPKGLVVVPHSTSGYEETYAAEQDSRGRVKYRITGGPARKEDLVTDVTSLSKGYITVTALHFNMTDEVRNADLKEIETHKEIE
ncbi:5'/3'-nucleotidase SurE [Anaerohalosphaera lusitana]|uniref:5'-nucleotidase SurE n=1 Tax=Anaerohalosphaera lusitana TaxID=1936003 RepID=A0A1U9NP76_9BACT|nr:5'/3'-nucleotidase SurE [Anaerohalosphaera lusitana]AQT69544.1 5'/3'-nucleotidase SurE [Anaerohalosphaera lusitana]